MGIFSRRVRVLSVLKIGDVVAMSVAFCSAALLVSIETRAPSISHFLSMRFRLLNFLVFIGLLAAWHGCFRWFRLYHPDRALLGRADLVDALKATALGAAILCLAAVVFGIALVTPAFVTCLWAMAASGVVLLRMGLQWVVAFAGGDALLQRRVLIAGSGPRALRLAQELESDPASGVRVVGFADEEWPGMQGFRARGLVVSDLKNLASFLRDHVVDEIFVALPLRVLGERRSELFAACREHGITLRFPASLLVDAVGPARQAGFARHDIIFSQYHGTIGGWPLIAKRIFDLILVIPLLGFSVPLLAIVALAIKLTSPGPVLFTQERVGFNKRRFRMYKFRSMVCGAEVQIAELEHLNETEGPTFKLTNDPRVTRLGKHLRSWSIDELPQLLNVLRGEMSLVGPRPLPVRDVERFQQDRHRRRFSVLPGLTGLWQVSGRSAIPFDEWIELDLKYIDDWSLGLDLKILVKTIPAVLLRQGAR